MLQINPNKNVSGSFYLGGKLLIAHNGNTATLDDFKKCFCSFDVKGLKGVSLWSQKTFTALEPFNLYESNLFPRTEMASRVSEDGSLSMTIEVTIKSTRIMKNVTYKLDPLGKLSSDLAAALDSNDFKDLKLIVGKKEIMANKFILAARSHVFKTMFLSGLEEVKQNQITITDIKFDTLQELINYIYTGQFTARFSTLAMELFEAAHKYQINDLVKACEMEIFENLNEENAEQIHNIISLYTDCNEELKKTAFGLYKK